MRRQDLFISRSGKPRRVSMALARVFAAVLTASLCGGASADGLTPEHFVAVELVVREMTLADMEARLELLQADAYDQEQQRAEVTATEIGRVYATHGTTPHDHAGYGAANAQAIAAWLDAHRDEQQRLSDLNIRFKALSEQFNVLRTGGE